MHATQRSDLRFILIWAGAFAFIALASRKGLAQDFERDILPIFRANCLACHNATERQGDLVLETPQTILAGGDSGPAVVAGNPEQSLIWKLSAHQEEPVMPPTDNDVGAQRLSAAQLDLLAQWIRAGATGTVSRVAGPTRWSPLPAGIHPVQAISITSDGQFAAACRANRIEIIHVPTGQVVTRLSDPSLDEGDFTGIAHRDLIQSLTFNRSGDRLASGSFREVKIWQRPRDVQLWNLPLGQSIEHMSLSADRSLIAVSLADQSIQVISSDGRMLIQAQWPANLERTKISALEFSPDATRVVSAHEDGALMFWQVADGTLVDELRTPLPVTAFAFVPWEADSIPKVATETEPAIEANRQDESWRLVTGHSDNKIRVWQIPNSLANPALATQPSAPTEQRTALAPVAGAAEWKSLSSVWSAWVNADRKLSLAKENQLLTQLDLPADSIGWWLLQAADVNDPPSVMWVTATGQVTRFAWKDSGLTAEWTVQLLAPSEGTWVAASGSSNGSRLAAGRADGSVILYDLAAGPIEVPDPSVPASEPVEGQEPTPIPTIKTLTALGTAAATNQSVTSISFAPDQATCYVTQADGQWRGLDPNNGQPRFTASHGAKVLSLRVTADSRFVTTAGEDGKARTWTRDGAPHAAQSFGSNQGPMIDAVLTLDNTVIVSALRDTPRLQWFDVATGQELQRHSVNQAPILALIEVSPGRIASIDTQTAASAQLSFQRTLEGHGQIVTCFALVPRTTRQIWSGSVDTTIRRWNLENGQALAQINHGAPVTDFAVRSDGERLASVSDGRTLKLWRSNGQQIIENRGDVRLRVAALEARQRRDAATVRANQAKQRFEQAERDLPTRQQVSTQADTALATANMKVTMTQADVDARMQEKLTAETAALQAVNAAKAAEEARMQAVAAVDQAKALLQQAQLRVQRIQVASNAAPNDQTLKQLLAEAMDAIAPIQQLVAAAEQAVAEPTRLAQETANAANTAAQQAQTVQKPYNDAVAALETAMTEQNLASQNQVVALREYEAAQALVPLRQQAQTDAEAYAAQMQTALEAAEKALQESEQSVRSVDFSPNGELWISGSDRASIDAWFAETGVGMGSFVGHQSAAPHVAFLSDDAFVSASIDGTLIGWNVDPEWQLERTIGSISDPSILVDRVTALDFAPSGTQLAVGSGVPSRSGELAIFDLETGNRIVHLPEAHSDSIYGIRFAPEGQRVASVGADRVLRVFAVADGSLLRKFEGHTHHVLSVDWKGDGLVIATGGADSTIKVWDAESGDQQRTIENNYRKPVTAVRYLGESDNLLACSGDKQVRLHNAANGGNQRNFGGMQSWVHCVSGTPDLQFVVAGDALGSIHIWNGQNGQQLFVLLPTQPTEPD